ncbi:MAG: DNA adenine methylase [Pseudomonadota bacterium]|nr:DNA adenine methylase [Pseudomonadota bacterium]
MSDSGQYHKRRHAARTTDDYVFHQLVPYLGNKRRLLPLIISALAQTGTLPQMGNKAASVPIFVDLFAGSGVVSRLARQLGYQVLANDWEPYSFALSDAVLSCQKAPAFAALGGYEAALSMLNQLEPVAGWLTQTFCPRQDDQYDRQQDRLFFKRHNGMRLDAMREQIARWQYEGWISSIEMSALLAPLLYSASFVSNTSGLFKSFHQGWGGKTATALDRIDSVLWLTPCVFHASPVPAEMHCVDAAVLARQLSDVTVDVVYLDPPYNQHAYASNYHILNALTLWNKPYTPAPMHAGYKSGIDRTWRTERPSAYNSSKKANLAYQDLIQQVNARFILTSYSTDGNIGLEALLAANVARGQVSLVTQDVPRYRVSRQRQSSRARTLEFIVVTDTQRPSQQSVEQLIDQLWHFAALGGVEREPVLPPESVMLVD